VNIAAGMAAGARVTLTLTFSMTTRRPVAFSLRLLAGPGSR
jgi:hypothetical protein